MIEALIDVSRSFSHKVNLGRYDQTRRFETMDFWCSLKGQCTFSQFDAVADKLYAMCESKVMAEAEAYIKKITLSIEPSIEQDTRNDAKAKLLRDEYDRLANERQALEKDKESLKVKRGGGSAPFPEALQEFLAVAKASGVDVEVAAPDIAPAPTLATAPAEEKPAPAPEPAPDAAAKAECEALYGEIAKLSGCTQSAKDEFFRGWFDTKPPKRLPRKLSLYLDPLHALLKVIKHGDRDAIKTVLAQEPRNFGAQLRKDFLAETLGPIEAKRSAPPAGPELPPLDLKDEDIFEVDPLMKHFGWKDIQTSALAKTLMAKWDHDVSKFDNYLTFLKIKHLTEPEIQTILSLLYHDAAAFELWKKAEEKGVSISQLAILIDHQLAPDRLSLSTPSARVTIAIHSVFETLRA